jgi:aldehyde dehydrogenase (NAD+)
MNSGQTCVAPDYLLINKNVKDEFLKLLQLYITKFYGTNTLTELNLPRIINEKHFDRLTKYLENRKPYCGGKFDRQNLQIEPTVLEINNFGDPLMQDEIFGPILPYIVCDDFADIINDMRLLPKPLALYIFSKDKKCIANLLATVQSGDVCINDTIMHTTNHNLPFGGVGSSGMGAYHGVYGFNLFSHTKSVVETTTKINPEIFYPPWTDKKTKFIKKIL